ncbi:MAG: hypothetical protein M1831_004571 [Alyxoria varia]|nr:MAG: hypothetical protein M1831_004571 [Alyxoria varia]
MDLLQLQSEDVAAMLGRLKDMKPLIPTYIHLIISALLPIYAAAYASLSRPKTAAKAPKRKKKGGHGSEQDDVDEPRSRMEGLSASDAIMFPLLAGCTLAGLYFLIKWLEDPAILNTLLNWYFALFSVFSVARLVSDSLDVVHSLLFPRGYIDKGTLCRVHPKSKTVLGFGKGQEPTRNFRNNPLPGPFSRLPLSASYTEFLWNLAVLPVRKLTIKTEVRKALHADVIIGIHGIEGLCVGLATVLYYNFVSKPWFLTNLMGFGFAYGALQLLSPTTFTTGSLVLGALFAYDIYFVFFTPMMVTVAKSLDIPIKLLFPRPPLQDEPDPTTTKLSMLGLGDIVLPGMMIGLALRFDLYLFYLRRQSLASRMKEDQSSSDETSLINAEETYQDDNVLVGDSDHSSEEEAKSSNVEKEQPPITKAVYTPVSSRWGYNFWTSRIVCFLLNPLGQYPYDAFASQEHTNPLNFPTPFFHATLIGYTVGMVTTLLAMQVSDHPQPALLYLVPGVVGALLLRVLLSCDRGLWALAYEFDDSESDEQSEDQNETKKESEKKGEDDATKGSESSADSKEQSKQTRGLFSTLFFGESKAAEEQAKRITNSNMFAGVFSTESRNPNDSQNSSDISNEDSTKGVASISETSFSDAGANKNDDAGSNAPKTIFKFEVVAPRPYWSSSTTQTLDHEDFLAGEREWGRDVQNVVAKKQD